MSRRGMSLAEVLVAASISLLLVGLTVATWVLASRGWGKTYRQQQAQQSNLISLTRLREDYRRTRPGSAEVSGPVLSFLVYDDGSGEVAWDSTGETLWRGWVQYRWEGAILRRRFQPLATPASQPDPTPPAWPPGESGRRLGHNLVACNWRLVGPCLEVDASSLFEGAECVSQLRVLPLLYQPD